MKRKIIKSLLAIACLLGSTSVSAYDFEVDGIYYNVVSLSELTCEVVQHSSCSGDIIIPATVNYSNRTLNVVGIADYAFYYCSGLESVTIPNSVTEIGDYVFNGCTKLTKVTIEDGETTLSLGYSYANPNPYWSDEGRGLFYDCPITTLYLGRNLSYNTGYTYGNSPFYNAKTLQEVTIGNSVTSIGELAFHGCSGLKSVTIGNSVTSIGTHAFYGCSSLTSVTIGNSVTSIWQYAFEGCSGLTSVVIGNSVTSIGSFAFYNCSSLTSLYSLNTTPPSVSNDHFNNFTNNQYMTLNVYVPQEALAAYQSADIWKNFWNLQGSNLTGIDATLMNNGERTIKATYDLGGKQLSQPQRGLNIVKMSDGTTKKVVVNQ